MRNGNKHTFIGQCENCGQHFSAKSIRAKTCSNACRLQKHRNEKRGNGKTWHFVRSEYAAKAQELSKVAPSAYKAICELLQQFGAIAAEYAIYAAYEAFEVLLNQQRVQQ